MNEFIPFPKMARLSRECVITEKIDGTNASILIAPGSADEPKAIAAWFDADTATDMVMFAGSRTRWITPTDDNFGFAQWAANNVEELKKLPPGMHFGEWWGSGIQRGYGLQKGEKRFSLFNVMRFHLAGTEPRIIPSADPSIVKQTIELPACVGLVPTLYQGPFSTHVADAQIVRLMEHGSFASPGFMRPEGIVMFHIAGNVGFKKTIEKDEEPKGKHV